MKAYIFPGQGSQFPGMGADLYETSPVARELFDNACDILGFDIKEIMFSGTEEDLMQTNVTQPAIFLHSVAAARSLGEAFRPDMVAGHSLGEFSSLVASGAISFEDGLRLVAARAAAMQRACEKSTGGMAAIIGLEDEKVEQICAELNTPENIVITANYNCLGQVVISGSDAGIALACKKLKEAGARRALPLPVGGAFHSPLMESARQELAIAIEAAPLSKPVCPVYQNVDALPHTDPSEIKSNLLLQLTSAVRWTQQVRNMIADGADEFIECGPKNVLTGLIARIRK